MGLFLKLLRALFPAKEVVSSPAPVPVLAAPVVLTEPKEKPVATQPQVTQPAPVPADAPAAAPKPVTLRFKLERQIFNDKCTIGKIWRIHPDGSREYVCWCLEDVLRPDGVKIKHKTAIPAGTYKVQVSLSNRFKRLMCELLGVVGFGGIRVHGGNTAVDSSGCLLVAKNFVDNYTIQGSMEQYFTDIVTKLKTAEIEIGYAAGVTPVYQTDINTGL